jgi:hypothetical protein
MVMVNMVVSPINPYQAYDAMVNTQNSSYEDPFSNTGQYPGDFWSEWQSTYGRAATVPPLVDYYNMYFGSETYNDIDLLVSSFDLMDAFFNASGLNPTVRVEDDSGNQVNNILDSSPVKQQTLSNIRIDSNGPARVQAEPGDIVVISSALSRSGLAQPELRFLILPRPLFGSFKLTVWNSSNSADPTLSTAIANLMARADWLDTAVNALSDAGYMTIGGDAMQSTLRYSDLKSIVNSFEFNVLSNVQFVPNGVGSTGVKADRSGFYSNIDAEAGLKVYYLSYGMNSGMDFYMLHEIAHNLPFVKSYELAKGAEYLAQNNLSSYDAMWRYSSQFIAAERFTNTVAAQIGEMLGAYRVFEPTHGYEGWFSF